MKILIIGIVASGKTSLAKELEKRLGISHFEIDSIVHDDLNKRKRSVLEQLKLIEEIDLNNDWIIEGTLRKNLDVLLEKSDKIIFMDISLKIRKRRIITRFIKQKFGLEKCNYKPTLEMLRLMFKWTKDFENNKDEFLERLLAYTDKVIRITDVLEINDVIDLIYA